MCQIVSKTKPTRATTKSSREFTEPVYTGRYGPAVLIYATFNAACANVDTARSDRIACSSSRDRFSSVNQDLDVVGLQIDDASIMTRCGHIGWRLIRNCRKSLEIRFLRLDSV